MTTFHPFRLLIVSLLLVTTHAHAGSTYKWVDSEGKVHYTDAPPAQGKLLHRSEQPAPNTGDTTHCQSLRRAAVLIASAMNVGTPSEEVPLTLRTAEDTTGERFNIDPAVQRQIVGYIYSFKHTHTSAATIADNVVSRCQNGAFNSTIKPRMVPEAESR